MSTDFSSQLPTLQSPSVHLGSSRNGGSRLEEGGNPRLWVVALFSLFACMGALLMGFASGYSSATLDQLNETAHSGDPIHGIRSDSTAETDAFAAMFPVGALFGGLIGGWMSDQLGRKGAIILGGVPQMIGWLMITYAFLAGTHGGFLAILLIGRLLTGLGVGWNSLSVPVYITEIATKRTKGFFGTWNQLFVTVGILMSESLGIAQGSSFKYYHISLIALGLVAVMEILMLFTYETPRWLVSHGFGEEAERELRHLRGPRSNVRGEIKQIKESLGEEERVSFKRALMEFKKRSVIIPLLLVLMLMFFQQLGGINAIVYFATQIFKDARVTRPDIVASFSVGGTQVVATIVSALLVERLGRRYLLVAGSIGMCLGSVMLGVELYLTRSNLTESSKYTPLTIISIILYNMAFSIGWGPIPWIMMSELTPLRVRGISTGIATAFNWLLVFVVSFSYNYYANLVRPYGAWWTFAGFMLISIFCVWFLLPETKNRSLEEIQKYFEPSRPSREEDPRESSPLLKDNT